MIDYLSILEKIKSNNFCIVKLPTEVTIKQGSDIDILTLDKDALCESILLNIDLKKTHIVKVNKQEDFTHIDIIENGSVLFRFDLISSLGGYGNVILKPSFFNAILASQKNKTYTIDGLELELPSADLYHEALFRYVEFHEYISERPDKIKHQEFIINELKENTDFSLTRFYELFHYYVDIPSPKINFFTKFKNKFENFFLILIFYPSAALRILRNEGVGSFIKKLKRKIK
ncbi:hypothetical protein VC87395_000270 [Vibrio paracholerae 87395]|uniref:hypothetical protein n=1 Tax=Vibrio paracholerae TaxID=650003 RepID=UPI0002C17E16|nr:hypothetical protein [Vibrio paracholerae]EMP95084.1 hypothetical protein VC87395_000270 [Vibrio paracholerae 87395]